MKLRTEAECAAHKALMLTDDEIDEMIVEAARAKAKPIGPKWNVKRIAATLDAMRDALITANGGIVRPK